MQLSWKVILAPIFGAFFGWLASLGLNLSPDQQTTFTALIMSGGATFFTWLGHYWHEWSQSSAVPPAGPNPQNKQAGFILVRQLLFPIAVLVTILIVALCAACTTLTFDEQLASAYSAHTAVVNAAATATTAGTLSSGDATQVLTMAKSSRSLLDAAREAETAGNASGASGELALATSALTALQTFVNSKTGSKTP